MCAFVSIYQVDIGSSSSLFMHSWLIDHLIGWSITLIYVLIEMLSQSCLMHVNVKHLKILPWLLICPGGASVWAITPEEKGKHDKQFDTLTPVLGYVSGRLLS